MMPFLRVPFLLVLGLPILLIGAGERADTVIPGWRSDFDSCRKEAEVSGRPLVLVWGTSMCPHCRMLKSDLATNETVLAWREKKDYVFCSVQEKDWRDRGQVKRARVFAATAGGTTKSQPASYPYVCLYHKPKDGKVLAASFTTESATVLMEAAERVFAGLAPTNLLSSTQSDPTVSETITDSSFTGYYTVQLPIVEPSSNLVYRGVANLILDIRSPNGAENVVAHYSGVLPNGVEFIGSAPLSLLCVTNDTGGTATVARVNIVDKTSEYEISLPLEIKPFASRAWKNPSVPEGLPAVFAAKGSRPVCRMGRDGQEVALAVYGAFFRRNRSPKQLCDLFDYSPRMVLRAGLPNVVSERFGKVQAWPKGRIVAGKKGFSPAGKKSGLSISYDPLSGTVSGSGTIRFADHSVKGEFRGVLLPGWIDCHCGAEFTPRPFAAGLFLFKDYRKEGDGWVEMSRSIPFEIVAK